MEEKVKWKGWAQESQKNRKASSQKSFAAYSVVFMTQQGAVLQMAAFEHPCCSLRAGQQTTWDSSEGFHVKGESQVEPGSRWSGDQRCVSVCAGGHRDRWRSEHRNKTFENLFIKGLQPLLALLQVPEQQHPWATSKHICTASTNEALKQPESFFTSQNRQ